MTGGRIGKGSPVIQKILVPVTGFSRDIAEFVESI
jgi:hypothetical protein